MEYISTEGCDERRMARKGSLGWDTWRDSEFSEDAVWSGAVNPFAL